MQFTLCECEAYAVKIVTTHPCENTTVTKTDNQVQYPTWLTASKLGYPDWITK